MIIANNNPHLHSFEQIRGVIASAENIEKTKDSWYVATQLTLHGVLNPLDIGCWHGRWPQQGARCFIGARGAQHQGVCKHGPNDLQANR